MKNQLVLIALLSSVTSVEAGTLKWNCTYSEDRSPFACSMQMQATSEELTVYKKAKKENACLNDGLRLLQEQTSCLVDLKSAKVAWSKFFLIGNVEIESSNCDAIIVTSVRKTEEELSEENARTITAKLFSAAPDMESEAAKKEIDRAKTIMEESAKASSKIITIDTEAFSSLSAHEEALMMMYEAQYQMAVEAAKYKTVASCPNGMSLHSLDLSANTSRINFAFRDLADQICVQ